MKRVLATALMVVAALGAWWFLRPAPDDRAQILGHLETIRRSVQTDNPRGITSHLSEEFRFGSMNRREINSHLTGFFWSNDAVDLQMENLQVEVKGEAATSRGSYLLKWRTAPDQPFTERKSDFTLRWRKIEGIWKIESATGGENLAF